ncbi:GAF domain-containing protein [Pseudacidovorax sp. RU35E]|uniref:GAF domain-containing protein n=1 Tax=Pseudacidovorax sp. RU35E TaxID=1907403 RepID=UPI00095408B6|nr:GAF domain-containing protein [Pseudacidovorax sp. RU35E]SIQ49345.1 Bacteriophytochrome (light-regulated signal transduction histidine kinase) [Pseudacidovorax sp. RU35E]
MSTVAVTLENCDREPIHVPGSIQSHGALLAFDPGRRLAYCSVNARQFIGAGLLRTGEVPGADWAAAFPVLAKALDDALRDADPQLSLQHEVHWDGRTADLLVHRSGDLVVLELEARDAADEQVLGYALKAHRTIDRLKRQPDIDTLLQTAASAVRELTGFDRVMAYRFLPDGSGEVVAEDRQEVLEPFAGRRYPASDIPAQARRLYLVNTLRLIADVDAPAIPVERWIGRAGELDMSHCVLRSVSPIHIEYLRNMGVRASMSISIVVEGELWGMIACHHQAPRLVPYAIRMACDVLAQVLAANVQSLLARKRARAAEMGAQLRAQVTQAALHGDELLAALAPLVQPIAQAFDAQAVVLAQEGKLVVHGDLHHEIAAGLVQSLQNMPLPERDLVVTHALKHGLPPPAPVTGPWCGLLGLRFDAAQNGWVLVLRKEQIETINWGGKPDKEYATGPNGPRLTPRGSFDLWKQEVRGTSAPWTEFEQDLARQLLDELVRAHSNRLAEMHRARTQLLAMLGHDLRDPLQSISMAARVLEKGGQASDAPSARLGQRIQSSSSRMARLIAQVLDASRLQAQLGLQIRRMPVDLARLLEDLLDETIVAYPGVRLLKDIPVALHAEADPDRMAQLFGNLLSNARHHGLAGEPVTVRLLEEGAQVRFEVLNRAPPIAPELVADLFSAFKRAAQPNTRNKGGLGLGLHIAEAIAREHGGDIQYEYRDGQVCFSAVISAR